MTTSTSVPEAEARAAADAFLRVYATLRGSEGVFTEDAFFDINVPEWRFQLTGRTAFTDWLHEYTQEGYELRAPRTVATADGFVVEVEGRYEYDGRPLYFRNLVLGRLAGRRIDEIVFYCTGDWSPETQARHAADVTLLRP